MAARLEEQRTKGENTMTTTQHVKFLMNHKNGLPKSIRSTSASALSGLEQALERHIREVRGDDERDLGPSQATRQSGMPGWPYGNDMDARQMMG